MIETVGTQEGHDTVRGRQRRRHGSRTVCHSHQTLLIHNDLKTSQSCPYPKEAIDGPDRVVSSIRWPEFLRSRSRGDPFNANRPSSVLPIPEPIFLLIPLQPVRHCTPQSRSHHQVKQFLRIL